MTPNGSAIRDFRQLRGISLRRFARLIGKDPGFWSRVETDKQGASDDTLHAAAAVLDVSIRSITREITRDQEEPGRHPH
ncbi:helix-turn-helix domain-containing protein [Actinacidiphila sp. ITFR-21]|uniref:helix-turn-helix domain-containing protein n=1 Tax=Actinacidiphila sp. ITFR-21 TaxID=3075199 RepID=UPI0037D9C5FC